jgi:ELWxxDGT repeat protein
VLTRIAEAADPTRQDSPQQFTRSGNRAYFVTRVGPSGRQLWVTDGTPAGTRVVTEVTVPEPAPTPAVGIDNPTDVNGTLYFTTDLEGPGQELWATDGTAAGTRRIKTVNPSPSSNPFGPPGVARLRQLTAVGTKLYFAADDGAHGAELWVSDGTAAGTKLVRDINPGGGSAPTDLTALNGKVYFTADDGTANGRQLWVSDGTAAGTKLAATIAIDAPPGWSSPLPTYYSNATPPRGMVAAGGKLYLTGYDPTHGAQLWVSDGTQAGTTRLTSFGQLPPYMAQQGIGGLTAVGTKVYFLANDNTGRQLWVTDGTRAGTRVVKEFAGPNSPANPLQTGGSPSILAVVGDRLVFAANDPATGRELWVTDGTAAGTKLIRDFNPGPGRGVGGGDPYTPEPTAAAANGRLVLAAFEPTRGAEPWTVPVADFAPTSPPVSPPVSPPTTPVRAALVRAFAVTAAEGAAFTANLATVTLPDGPTYRVTVFWGNGRTSAGTLTRMTPTGSTYLIAAGHAYADPGHYAVMIRVTADFRTVLSIDTTAAVKDSRFYVGRVAQRLTVTSPFSGVVATIRDLNPRGGKASDYAATIDWGNGATGTGTIRQVSPGRFEVVGSTAFTTTGTRTVKVTVKSVATGVTAVADSIFIIDPLRGR